ncbi:DUF2182 domain-containing protein [Nocardia sp. 2]|uniref:DUF2182 domain-containing protein n=1 Tax=Nocardia acididurans TaxID=2802282 RepID=A0ABS1MGM6_9NOCA|nr:DUF2182 domain-containing protein [Nocardia acididurans]MBL1079820.1 DUF2182 domain-containing protein [Nocardia acididurans]
MTALAPKPGLRQRFRWNHPELSLAILATSAWVAVVLLHLRAGHPVAHAPATHHRGAANSIGPPPFPYSVTVWFLMATAMMLPTVLPAARSIARNGKWKRRRRGPALFALGYLATWTAFGAVLLYAIRVAGPKSPDLLLVSAALLLAALWESTRWKRHFLRACHRIPPIPPDGPRADRACLRAGFRNGLHCMGSCAPMMLPMALAPHAAALPLMLFLTGLIWAEKSLTRAADHLRLFAGLLAAAALVLSAVALTA